MKEKRRAVVLGGGGGKGAYQAGVFRALKEVGYDYHLVTGTSVGSLNGACMVMKELELCQEIWKNISLEKILDFVPGQGGIIPKSLENWFLENEILEEGDREKGVLSTLEKLAEAGELVGAAVREKSLDQSPLKELLQQYVDVEKLYASPVDFGLVTVTFPQLKPCYLYKRDIPKDRFIDFLMASCACFPAMKPWEIDGQQYIDGGYWDNLPIQMAVDWGAEEVIAVDLNAVGVKRKLKKEWTAELTVIAPLDDLGFLLSFDGDQSRVNMSRGYFDAMKAFGRMEGREYTFEKGAFSETGAGFRSFQKGALQRLIPDGKMEKAVEKFLFRRMERKLEMEGMSRRFLKVEVKETVSMEALERLTEKEERKQIGMEDAWVLASAETAGRIFRISPMECYSKSSFDAALRETISSLRLRNLDDREDRIFYEFEDFKDDLDWKGFVEGIRKIGDEREQTLFLMEGVKGLIAEDGKLSLKNWKRNEESWKNLFLGVTAQILLEELIAAVYCIYYEL